jgi:hypothetical protein
MLMVSCAAPALHALQEKAKGKIEINAGKTAAFKSFAVPYLIHTPYAGAQSPFWRFVNSLLHAQTKT